MQKNAIKEYRYKQALEQELSKDVVSRGVFEQVMWERDVAIEQLKGLGYELGQKVKPCDDAISRQAVLSMQYRIDDSATLATRDVVNVEDIEDLPPVTLQQKTGHWIRVDKDKCKCDQCEVISFIAMYPNGDKNYCPNCGAKMVEPQERCE